MNKIKKIIVIIIAVFIVLGFSKNYIIKTAIKLGIKGVVGVDAEIKKFSMSLISQKIEIKNFKLFNPEGYEDKVLMHFPAISVEYDLLSLIRGKLNCKSFILNLKEMVLIKNKNGVLNVDKLKISTTGKDTEKKKEKEVKKPAKEMPMQIDRVVLTIGKVVYKDYSKEGKPEIKIFDVGIKEKEYKNINSAQELAALVMATSMKATTIKSAAIYGAATVLGVGFLPAGVAGVLISKDSAQEEFSVSYNDAFVAAEKVIRENGADVSVNRNSGEITAKIGRTKIKIEVSKVESKLVTVTVSARKMLIPQRQEAEKILYKIKEILE